MKTLGKIAIAIIVLAFAINEVNAQVRVTRVKTGVKTSKQFFKEESFRIRNGIYNAPLRSGTYIEYRPTRVYNLRGQIRPAYFTGYRTNRLANQVLINELNEQLYEDIRARKLYKYVTKPNKRNKKKLIKWNILTGRDSHEDVN